MKEQVNFIRALYRSLEKSVADFQKFKENSHSYLISAAYGDKNYSKTAIKRKITLLRQELLNLERMIDG